MKSKIFILIVVLVCVQYYAFCQHYQSRSLNNPPSAFHMQHSTSKKVAATASTGIAFSGIACAAGGLGAMVASSPVSFYVSSSVSTALLIGGSSASLVGIGFILMGGCCLAEEPSMRKLCPCSQPAQDEASQDIKLDTLS